MQALAFQREIQIAGVYVQGKGGGHEASVCLPGKGAVYRVYTRRPYAEAVMKRSLCSLLLGLAAACALAQPAPIPPVTHALPGQVQPIPPGYRAAQALPTLTLARPIPGLQKVESLSNGFIEVAHALILVPNGAGRDAVALERAQAAVAASFAARPGLAEVDVSVYAQGSYGGFGGPPPVLTASVPAPRQAEFARLKLNTLKTYDRVWLASAATPTRTPPDEAFEGPETIPAFVGSQSALQAQRLKQSLSSVQGSSLQGSVFYQGSPKERRMALTFDDGVHPLYEPLILDALRRGGAKATFFIVGRNARAYPYFVRDIAREGHEVANHTFHHVRLPHLSEAAIRQELTSADRLLTQLSGQDLRFFRPPGGRFSLKVLQVAKSEGLITAMWTDDPGDFNNIGQAQVEGKLLKHLRPGGIILLHENVPDTVNIMTDLIHDARGQGYTLTTLRQLSGLR